MSHVEKVGSWQAVERMVGDCVEQEKLTAKCWRGSVESPSMLQIL